MTTDTTVPQEVAYDEWRERRWRVTGMLVVLLWLATAALTVTLGERRSDLGRLQDALSAGTVSEVEVAGYPEEGIGNGYARVELHWDGWVDRYAEVVVAFPREPYDGSFNPEGLPVIVGDPADALRSFDEDVQVTYSDNRSSAGGFLGWQGPQSILLLGIAAWLAAILLAFNGPQPWRVTRWGWAWFLVFAGPVGSGLYLLLGGPLGLWPPRNPDRRLTGGWALLIAMVLFGGSNGR